MLSDENINNRVVIINKPPKMSSHEASAIVKKIIGAKRSGHAGTLDPQVSGVLVVALGRSTKLLQFLDVKDKTYVCLIKFKKILPKEEIESLFKKFTGEITQIPPKQSAVRKVPRKRKVHYIKFLEQSSENPRLVLFEAKVDAGTYIRTLCDDIAKLCGGARMEELRRISSGQIGENIAYTLQQFSDAVWFAKNKDNDEQLKLILHKPEEFIDFPKIVVKDSALISIKNGAQIMLPAIKKTDAKVKKNGMVKLYSENNLFFGIGESMLAYSEYSDKKHGLAVKLLRVHL